MFCLAVATEFPNDLKNPVSLSTSYRSLQPLKNSATSFVPTYPPSNHLFYWLLDQHKQQASKQQASKRHIYHMFCTWGSLSNGIAESISCNACLGLNKHDKPSAGLSTFTNCIVQAKCREAKCRDTDCIVVHRNADLGPFICVLLIEQHQKV